MCSCSLLPEDVVSYSTWLPKTSEPSDLKPGQILMYSFLWYSDNADLASNWNLSEACSSLWVQPVD